MCEYCKKDNTEEYLQGSNGVLYREDEGKHYLFIEHFSREKYWIEVNYCPQCGTRLEEENN